LTSDIYEEPTGEKVAATWNNRVRLRFEVWGSGPAEGPDDRRSTIDVTPRGFMAMAPWHRRRRVQPAVVEREAEQPGTSPSAASGPVCMATASPGPVVMCRVT